MPTTVPSPVPAAALELLLERGFDSTSVDELAAAAGVSRSTFFRRFGSKEDMVFSDQEDRIRAAAAALEAASGPQALVSAALAVFDHQTSNPQLSRLRHELLHRVPSLRDRELISTHRFERLFRTYLLSGAPSAQAVPDARRTHAVALAAAVVAVHNDHLRAWLRSPSTQVRPRLEAALWELLGRLDASATAGRAASDGGAVDGGGADGGAVDGTATEGTVTEGTAGTTVVVVTTAGQSPRSVAAAVERTLRERG